MIVCAARRVIEFKWLWGRIRRRFPATGAPARTEFKRKSNGGGGKFTQRPKSRGRRGKNSCLTFDLVDFSVERLRLPVGYLGELNQQSSPCVLTSQMCIGRETRAEEHSVTRSNYTRPSTSARTGDPIMHTGIYRAIFRSLIEVLFSRKLKFDALKQNNNKNEGGGGGGEESRNPQKRIETRQQPRR